MSASSRRSRSLDSSAVMGQLLQARQYITSLEAYVRERERHYQSAIAQLRSGEERRESRGPLRGRRVGRSHDIFMVMRHFGSLDQEEDEDEEDGKLSVVTEVLTMHSAFSHLLSDIIHKSLGQFVRLKLVKVCGEDAHDDLPIPFALRRIIGREYHVGPEGVLIGTGGHCAVRLPVESGTAVEHCLIAWEGDTSQLDGNGHFVIQDKRKDKEAGTLIIKEEELSLPAVAEEDGRGTNIPAKCSVPLTRGTRFITGQLEWLLTALPPSLENTAKAFHLAKQQRLAELVLLLDSFEPPVVPLPSVAIDGADVRKETLLFHPPVSSIAKDGVDINQPYLPPAYDDEKKIFETQVSRRLFHDGLPPSSPYPSLRHPPQLLLHVAIGNRDLNMVKYLLDKGADVSCSKPYPFHVLQLLSQVNLMSGEMNYSAVHLAALANLAEVMPLLLARGADLELRNIEHLTPLSLTTSYEIRWDCPTLLCITVLPSSPGNFSLTLFSCVLLLMQVMSWRSLDSSPLTYSHQMLLVFVTRAHCT